jgi:hypothetical protein
MYVPQNQSAVAGNNSVHWMVYADTAFNATTTVKCIVQYAYWVSPGEEMQGSAVFNIDATKTSGISGDLGNAPWIRPSLYNLKLSLEGPHSSCPIVFGCIV